MNLQHRISLLAKLGQYLENTPEDWKETVERAGLENGWFTADFVNAQVQHIANNWLNEQTLSSWAKKAGIPEINEQEQNIGIVMAGNIPLVGFHDWLCVFISGHKSIIKASSKDQVLITKIFNLLSSWEPGFASNNLFAERLTGCDAYIATGSNNSSRYFEYYFSKYPNIIRKNRTSIAILTGNETNAELSLLADDVYLYFGLGCRNVTKIYVPAGYDFIPLLTAFRKYNLLADHHKYKNNYDYNLALHILNKKYYMTNDSILLIEDQGLFSPISQLNYSFYENIDALHHSMLTNQELQCIVGYKGLPFGQSQFPAISEYADGVNTLDWLLNLTAKKC